MTYIMPTRYVYDIKREARRAALYRIRTVLGMIYVICVTAECHLRVLSNRDVKRVPALATAVSPSKRAFTRKRPYTPLFRSQATAVGYTSC